MKIPSPSPWRTPRGVDGNIHTNWLALYNYGVCENTSSTYTLYYSCTCAYRIPAGRLNNNPLPVQRGLPQRHAETRAFLLNSPLSSRQPPVTPPHGQRPASSSGTHPRRAPQDAPAGTTPAPAAPVSQAVPSGEHGGAHGPGQQPGRHPARVRYSARVQREEHHREEGEGPRLG